MKSKLIPIIALFTLFVAMAPHDSYAQIRKSSWQKNQSKYNRKIANENLNGHYITLGSSILSSGYYGGIVGVGYEYRHHIFAPNIAVGAGLQGSFLNANAGVKLYLANNTTFLRNLYFNFLPVCYFGQYEVHKTYYSLDNNAIVNKIDEFTYPHLYGVGLFFGYAPAWRLNQAVWLGFNVGIGVKTTYKFEFNPKGYPQNHWRPINWDVGMVLKFEHYKEEDRLKRLYNIYKKQRGR